MYKNDSEQTYFKKVETSDFEMFYLLMTAMHNYLIFVVGYFQGNKKTLTREHNVVSCNKKTNTVYIVCK